MLEKLNEIKSTLKNIGEKVDKIADKVEAGVKPKFKCNVDENNINVKAHNSCYEKVKKLGYKELIVENDGCIGAPNLYRYKVLDNDENKVAEFYTLKGVKEYLDKQNKNA
ncbi:hypothetical protein [Moorena bouillonii]|uniref:Uncharacterized protein n=1 Tax=Moorena bouillonii PNG TaxID=568701 RepID=A0A1U7N8J6_9CYAN|nr:hypothetical protein [Moorena bouillonii]OLT62266.1 hypothetical protein BJP37_27860 [Moorena bouillonii PNG]